MFLMLAVAVLGRAPVALQAVVVVLGDILPSGVLVVALLLEMVAPAVAVEVVAVLEVAAAQVPAVEAVLAYMARAATVPAELRPDVRAAVAEVVELKDKIILPQKAVPAAYLAVEAVAV
jgi:hypothetical protein